MAHDKGLDIHVWVDETRPRNQGSFLTAWELGQHGVPHTVVADNVGGHLMQHGQVDLCITGTDRTVASGDVANKIGTYLKALAAHDNNVPFYVGAAGPHNRLDPYRRDFGYPDRTARLIGTHESSWTDEERRTGNGIDHRARERRRQLCFRRDTGAPRYGSHYGARHSESLTRRIARPLPGATAVNTSKETMRQKIRRILNDAKSLAVVGGSSNWKRPSFYVMKYMQKQGIPHYARKSAGRRERDFRYASLCILE